MAKISTQTDYLENARKNKTRMSVITTNGFQMDGTIVDFDDYVITLRGNDNVDMMVYKHAISTIRPYKQRPPLNK